MKLVERRRGDADAAPDQLALTRTLWLDFDGGGYTMHDRITGTLTRAWRLDMAPPTALGRVAVDGTDQFITRLAADAPAGVEIRAGVLTLDADSRLDGATRAVPAVGWAARLPVAVGEAAAAARLAPAARHRRRSGAPDVGGDLDAARSVHRAHHRARDGPAVRLDVGRAGAARGRAHLHRVRRAGRDLARRRSPPKRWCASCRTAPRGARSRLVRVGALVALVIIAVPFLIGQVRQALYPALEHPSVSMTAAADNLAATAPPAQEADAGTPPPARLRRQVGGAGAGTPRPLRQRCGAQLRVRRGRSEERRADRSRPARLELERGDARVERAGRPRSAAAPLPAAAVRSNLLLAVVAHAAAGVAARAPGRACARHPVAGDRRRTAALLLALVAAGAGARRLPDRRDARRAARAPARAAGLSSVRAPPCRACASRSTPDAARPPAGRRRRRHRRAAARPGAALAAAHGARRRQAGRRADAGRRRRRCGCASTPARTRCCVEGPLPARDTVQILLPLLPRFGRDAGRRLDARRRARRRRRRRQPAAHPHRADRRRARRAAASRISCPPFARVERTLRLGLTWQVETRVVRLTPPESALVLVGAAARRRVGDHRRRAGRRRPRADQPRATGGRGDLAVDARRALADRVDGARVGAWVELWRLDAGPIWHVDASGIAPVLRGDPQRAAGARMAAVARRGGDARRRAAGGRAGADADDRRERAVHQSRAARHRRDAAHDRAQQPRRAAPDRAAGRRGAARRRDRRHAAAGAPGERHGRAARSTPARRRSS